MRSFVQRQGLYALQLVFSPKFKDGATHKMSKLHQQQGVPRCMCDLRWCRCPRACRRFRPRASATSPSRRTVDSMMPPASAAT